MIIVKLWGGLGNQMFQYAAARRLSLVNETQLKLDLSWFQKVPSGDTPRPYDLNVFNTVQNVASPAEVKALRGIDIRRWPKVVKRFLQGTGLFINKSYVMEKHYHLDPEILDIHGDVYLDGYWQSARYFSDEERLIRQEFTIKIPPDLANREVADIIRNVEAVSLHVRRGDYVSDHKAGLHHGISPLAYYKKAISEIISRVENPHFFVFSDEPEWVKRNLSIDHPGTYVEHNGPEKGFEDLRLMSLCRHHIIAKSSFSWWGAWLAVHQEKIVIAPKNWFSEASIDTSDLIPDGWIRI